MTLYRVINEFTPADTPIYSVLATYDDPDLAQRFVNKYGYIPEDRNGRQVWRAPYQESWTNYIWIVTEEV